MKALEILRKYVNTRFDFTVTAIDINEAIQELEDLQEKLEISKDCECCKYKHQLKFLTKICC